MSILAALNARTLELRKARDPLAATFQQIQAGATAAAKSRALDAEVTDADAVAALKKAQKNVNDLISVLQGQGIQAADGRYVAALAELEAIESLLPARPDPQAVREAAESFLVGQEKSMKLMGTTMAHLRETFGDSLDNAEASQMVKALLS